MQELGPNQERCIRRLELNDLPQGKERLKTPEGGYCCLGVFCVELGVEEHATISEEYDEWGDEESWPSYSFGANAEQEMAPNELIELLALRGCNGGSIDPIEFYPLVDLNDIKKKTFPEIAAILRANPEQYFTEPR